MYAPVFLVRSAQIDLGVSDQFRFHSRFICPVTQVGLGAVCVVCCVQLCAAVCCVLCAVCSMWDRDTYSSDDPTPRVACPLPLLVVSIFAAGLARCFLLACLPAA